MFKWQNARMPSKIPLYEEAFIGQWYWRQRLKEGLDILLRTHCFFVDEKGHFHLKLVLVAHACYPSTSETEARVQA